MASPRAVPEHLPARARRPHPRYCIYQSAFFKAFARAHQAHRSAVASSWTHRRTHSKAPSRAAANEVEGRSPGVPVSRRTTPICAKVRELESAPAASRTTRRTPSTDGSTTPRASCTRTVVGVDAHRMHRPRHLFRTGPATPTRGVLTLPSRNESRRYRATRAERIDRHDALAIGVRDRAMPDASRRPETTPAARGGRCEAFASERRRLRQRCCRGGISDPLPRAVRRNRPVRAAR